MFVLGIRAETSSRTAGAQGYENEGIRGLKALGVRELSYRLAFLACHVAPTNPRVRIKDHHVDKFLVWSLIRSLILMECLCL